MYNTGSVCRTRSGSHSQLALLIHLPASRQAHNLSAKRRPGKLQGSPDMRLALVGRSPRMKIGRFPLPPAATSGAKIGDLIAASMAGLQPPTGKSLWGSV